MAGLDLERSLGGRRLRFRIRLGLLFGEEAVRTEAHRRDGPVPSDESESSMAVIEEVAIADSRQGGTVNKKVRGELFAPPYPASTALVAGGFLFDGMLVEIEAVGRVAEPRT